MGPRFCPISCSKIWTLDLPKLHLNWVQNQNILQSCEVRFPLSCVEISHYCETVAGWDEGACFLDLASWHSFRAFTSA